MREHAVDWTSKSSQLCNKPHKQDKITIGEHELAHIPYKLILGATLLGRIQHLKNMQLMCFCIGSESHNSKPVTMASHSFQLLDGLATPG